MKLSDAFVHHSAESTAAPEGSLWLWLLLVAFFTRFAPSAHKGPRELPALVQHAMERDHKVRDLLFADHQRRQDTHHVDSVPADVREDAEPR